MSQLIISEAPDCEGQVRPVHLRWCRIRTRLHRWTSQRHASRRGRAPWAADAAGPYWYAPAPGVSLSPVALRRERLVGDPRGL